MVANKFQKPRRKYDSTARARQAEATRQRITEAAVRLHESVGPARTTISEVARLAGVRRMTVYNHFATDIELIDACSSHWLRRHPPPDALAWTRITDLADRRAVALRDLYAWYRAGESMMAHSLRDEASVPALAEIMGRKWWPYLATVVVVLAAGQSSDRAVTAAIRLAVDFHTWQTLAAAGLSDDEAVRLAARCIGAAPG